MKLRRVLILLGILGLVIIVVGSLGQWDELVAALQAMRWYLIPMLVLAQFGSYWALAGFYQDFFRMNSHIVGFGKLLEVTLAINFAGTAIPAGGIVGTAYVAEALRDEVPPGQAALSQVTRYVFTYLSFVPILGVGLVMLFADGSLGNLSVNALLLGLGMIATLVVAVVFVMAQRRRLELVLKPFVTATNWLWQQVLRQPTSLIGTALFSSFLDDLYRSYNQLAHHSRYRLQLLWWTFATNMFEVVSLYAVFVGFGIWPNFGVAVVAYAVANILSVASIATNGIGAFEASMVATITALGQPVSDALAVVIVFRTLSMVFFLPPGFVYYRKYLKNTSTPQPRQV